MTPQQTENNAPKNSAAPNNDAPAAGHRPHGGPHGASEDPQNIYLLKEAPILKALLSLGVPMALGLAITSVYNVVNSYFVGHYGGTEDL
ncbi:MAG: MATE family efflux transporter, partial [Rothia mucilaginosa]|nr:MATE family efflux transporter [Rothia mucilaginosa]